MIYIITWAFALILLIPTYGTSLIIATIISFFVYKATPRPVNFYGASLEYHIKDFASDTSLHTIINYDFYGIPVEYQIKKLYLNFCKQKYRQTFYIWQYNGNLLIQTIKYVYEKLSNNEYMDYAKQEQILEKTFKVVYTYQKTFGLNSGSNIDFKFLNTIITHAIL